MQRLRLDILSLAVVLALAAPAAADTVDNPQYKEWAQWREGATVTTRTESIVDGAVQVVNIQTQTLKKLSAEKAVVEILMVTEAAGHTMKTPPQTMDIVAKFPKVNYTPPPTEKSDTPEVKYKESKGRETLTIKGKKVDCEWHMIEMEGGMSTKTWTSKQIPGGVVKMESRSPQASSNLVVTEFVAEKN
jgi:hypothetical protein